jgi:hypothetical protein
MVILFFLWLFSTVPFPCGEDLVERPERFALDVTGEDGLDRDGAVNYGVPRLTWCG